MSTAVITACTPGHTRARRLSIARMRPWGARAAHDHGVQHALERKIIDVLSASPEKAKVFEPLDRAADEGVARAWLIHFR